MCFNATEICTIWPEWLLKAINHDLQDAANPLPLLPTRLSLLPFLSRQWFVGVEVLFGACGCPSSPNSWAQYRARESSQDDTYLSFVSNLQIGHEKKLAKRSIHSSLFVHLCCHQTYIKQYHITNLPNLRSYLSRSCSNPLSPES